MRINFRRLDEKTYIVGDKQYWRRNGKCYSWTESGGRVEIGEDEYMKAISTTNVKPASSETETKAKEAPVRRKVEKPSSYKDSTPEDLALLAQDGDKKAEEHLIKRYQPLVYKISNKYFLQGGDKEDLFQDGLIGLWDAIKTYDENKVNDFTKYAAMAVDARMKNSIRADNTQKASVLNQATSMDAPTGSGDDDEGGRTLGEKLPSKHMSIEDEIMGVEGARKLTQFIKTGLSDKERDVITRVIKGDKPAQIAKDTGLPYKTVENSIMRARAKIAEYTKKMDESKKIKESKKEVMRKGNLRIRFRKQKSLDERTYTVGDTQYWRRNGKCYSWTQAGGRKECSEDEYMKALTNASATNDSKEDPIPRDRPDIVTPELARHFNEENSRMDKFLSSNTYDKQGYASIEMSNGQVFEKVNHKGIKSYLSNYDDNTLVDTFIYCRYADGSTVTYSDGDYIKHIKTNGLVCCIEDNSATTVIYGDVKVENWNDTLAGTKMTRYGTSEDEDDWRADDALNENAGVNVSKNKDLEEASFDANGKHYSSVFGHYSCDGEPITRDEYFKVKPNKIDPTRHHSDLQGIEDSGLTHKDLSATSGYTDTTSASIINNLLRKGLNTRDYSKVINKLDTNMEEIKKPTTLYRGISSMDFLGDPQFDLDPKMSFDEIKKNLIGKSYTDKGFMSTSHTKNNRGYGSLLLRIEASPGTKAIWTGNDKEDEVILGRDQKFIVTDINRVKEDDPWSGYIVDIKSAGNMSMRECVNVRFRINKDLEESSFDLDGNKYVSKYGKYLCNGKPITKEEYRKAAMMLADKPVDPQSFEAISDKPSKDTSITIKELHNFTKGLTFDTEYEISRDTRGHLPRIDKDDKATRVSLIMKDSGMNKKEAVALNNALLGYTDTQKSRFSDYELGLLNTYLDKAPVFNSIPLYRGMGFKETIQDQVSDYEKFRDINEGSITDLRGITSVSSNPDIAVNFAQDNGELQVFMVITKNLTAVSIDCFTGINVNEDECLYKKDAKLKVIKKDLKDNKIFLQMEELDLSESANTKESMTLPIEGSMIINKKTDLDESGFMHNGKYYSCGFGNYTADGEKISREEYQKASEEYGKSKVSSLMSMIDKTFSKNSQTTSHNSNNSDNTNNSNKETKSLGLEKLSVNERVIIIADNATRFVNNKGIIGHKPKGFTDGHLEKLDSPSDIVYDLIDKFGYDEDTAEDLVDVLDDYSGDNIQPKTNHDKRLLNSLLDNTPVFYDENTNGIVYRGLRLNYREHKDFIENLEKSDVGDVVPLIGYTGFSSDVTTASNFAAAGTNEDLRVMIINDTNLSGKSLRRYSCFPDEDEVLYKPTARFVIKDKEDLGDLLLLHVSEENLKEADNEPIEINIGLEGNQHIYNKSDNKTHR